MDLTIYDIIKGPVITDKAFKLNKNLKKLVIRVHTAANKPLIKEALEKLFNVKVEKVSIIVRKGKKTSFKRIVSQKPTEKKAIITLKEGYAIDMFDQSQTTVSSAEETLQKD
jgi:large subunit ribosomal protein L23